MRIVRSAAAVSALALAFSASAQIPVPGGPKDCGGVEGGEPAGHLSPLNPRAQIRKQASHETNLCSVYTHGGWIDTMRLYLGEGALEYKGLIELAMKRWNNALEGFNRKPVIELAEVRPNNFSLEEDFWSRRLEISDPLSGDGQSVIYFKGGDPVNRISGYAHWRQNGVNMLESDIYMNLTDVEEYGSFLVETQALLSFDGQTSYAVVNSIYVTLLHELGHALGLQHVPVSGNIMSYNYMPFMESKWGVPATIQLFESILDSRGIQGFYNDGPFSAFTTRDSEVGRRLYFTEPTDEMWVMLHFFTESAGLGEQDRSALLCAYDFSDWNH